MSNEITFERVYRKGADEVRNVSLDFTKLLDKDETISTVSVTQATLTITNAAANTLSLLVNGRTVAVGCGLTFTVAGGVAGTTYQILISLTTSGGQTVKRYLNMEIIAAG